MAGKRSASPIFEEANLMEGDVTVRVEWSTVNYKDGLAQSRAKHRSFVAFR